MSVEYANEPLHMNTVDKNANLSALGATMFSFRYVTADIRKRLLSFGVGLTTIIIVVSVVSLLYNSVQKAPIIFLKLSEDQAGDQDLLFTAKLTNQSTSPFINSTDFTQRLQKNELIGNSSSPRWIVFGNIVNKRDPDKNISALLLMVDSEHEQNVGIGHSWPYRPLGEGECHIRNSLLSALDIAPNRGHKVNLRVELSTFINVLSGQTIAINEGATDDPEQQLAPTSVTSKDVRNLIHYFLDTQGINSTQPIYVNITEIAKRTGTIIPPPIKRVIDLTGGIWISPEALMDTFLPVNSTTDYSHWGIGGEYSVVDSVDSSYTKYASALGNVVVLDYRYVMSAIETEFRQNADLNVILTAVNYRDRFYSALRNFKMQHYALTVVAKYSERYKTYLRTEKEMDIDILNLTNSISRTMGVSYPVTATLPLAVALKGTRFISMFLDQIFTGVVLMLAVLGIILIFALLLANVEEKTYEYGMLRALGLKQNTLIQVIMSQSMYFAIPGVVIGMALSVSLNFLVSYGIAYATSLPFDKVDPFEYTWIAVVVPVALGIFIPTIANIIPIQRALGRSLRDSLDVTRQSFNETSVQMIKLEELGLEPWQTALASLMVVIGFCVYYGVPFAFVFQQFPLFFLILNTILMGMLFGLCMIAVVLQPILERSLLYVMLWGSERRLLTLITKNLAGHRTRSRKTFMMFTLAVAFVIFAGVAFSLQATNIISSVESLIGADVIVQSRTTLYKLPEQQIDDFLNKQKENGIIKDFGYASSHLTTLPFINLVQLSPLSYFPTCDVKVFAISENFLQFTFTKYFLYTSHDQYSPNMTYEMVDGKPDVFRSLYVDAGKAVSPNEQIGFQPGHVIYDAYKLGHNRTSDKFDPSTKYKTYVDMVISDAMQIKISAQRENPLQLRVFSHHPKTGESGGTDFIGKARALVYKVPGFFFSSYEVSAHNSPVLITWDTYLQIAKEAADTVKYKYTAKTVLKEKLLLRYVDGVTDKQRESILNGLRSMVNSDFTILQDVNDIKASTHTATTVLLGFFDIVAAIAVLLCFFMLTVSFTANVKENSWEFGVLRSIGLSVSKLVRAYIYEALVLVISAFFCGTVIGLAIAMTLISQFNLFLQMPFMFEFPYWLFGSIGLMAVVVAVLGSYFPARELRKKEIAYVLRGLE
ncbi:hypothetical protein AKO1_014032 [Acrasis kona]|uniref:ABC3 transporter permease C-terminal domain-containing protein n=1 Tax=Acrasis kona TaxID=1008807 RepID=A0AAW2Z3D2_9EUKA